jgi:hypothetical protein
MFWDGSKIEEINGNSKGKAKGRLRRRENDAEARRAGNDKGKEMGKRLLHEDARLLVVRG